MNARRQRALVSLAAVAVMVVVLVALAVLQYRWSDQIGEAERGRVQVALNASVSQFRLEFNRELIDLNAAFHEGPPPEQWDEFARRFYRWTRIARFPEIVSQVYLWTNTEASKPDVRRLDQDSWSFIEADHVHGIDALIEQSSERGPRRGFRGREARLVSWDVLDGNPVLLHAVSILDSRGEDWRRYERPANRGYLVIVLDVGFMREQFLPTLAQRYFGSPEGFSFQVGVLEGSTVIYVSEAGLGERDFLTADKRESLLWDGRGFFGRPPGGAGREGPFPGGPGPEGPPNEGPRREGPPMPPPDGGEPPSSPFPRGFPMLVSTQPGAGWDLVVRHPEGSLAAMVASVRRRNLAVSFGILLLLGTGMAIVFFNSQRAQRLARLQMDFVAGVSHELRTPLAVIRSAADNLAEGVVGSMKQAREYGALMRDESRRLSTMIEQTLQFSAVESGRKQYDLQPLDVAEVVDAAIRETETTIAAAGFELRREIPEGLPPVQADRGALIQALQNLITNAVKYGGEARWLAVQARPVAGRSGRTQISVVDRGIGIASDEIAHVFDPFYRGRSVVAAQIKGSGLGLSLSRDMIGAMGGRLTVESTVGRGSTFTIELPAAPESSPARTVSLERAESSLTEPVRR